jgi:hypothetical protein
MVSERVASGKQLKKRALFRSYLLIKSIQQRSP